RKRLYQEINKVRDDETLNGSHVGLAAAFQEILGKNSRLLEKEPERVEHAPIQMEHALRSQLEEVPDRIIVFAYCTLATIRPVPPAPAVLRTTYTPRCDSRAFRPAECERQRSPRGHYQGIRRRH